MRTGKKHWAMNGVNMNKFSRNCKNPLLILYRLECHNSHVPIDLVELIRGVKAMLGAIDVANNIETPKRWLAHCEKLLTLLMLINCILRNCGMAPLPRHVAKDKLKALSAGAEVVRQKLPTKRIESGIYKNPFLINKVCFPIYHKIRGNYYDIQLDHTSSMLNTVWTRLNLFLQLGFTLTPVGTYLGSITHGMMFGPTIWN